MIGGLLSPDPVGLSSSDPAQEQYTQLSLSISVIVTLVYLSYLAMC